MTAETKAKVLAHAGEIVLVVVALATGITINRLTPDPAPDLVAAAIVAVAFTVHGIVAHLLTAVLGPVIDRLLGVEVAGQDAELEGEK